MNEGPAGLLLLAESATNGDCADRCGENRRVPSGRRVCARVHGRAVSAGGLQRDSTEELLEERCGLGELGGETPSHLSHGGLGEYQTKETKLAEHQDRVAGARAGSKPAIRTSASTQTVSGSVFSGRATQILQGLLSRPAQTLHFSSEPWDDQQARAEPHRPIEVDHCQRASFTEPILLAQRRRERQGTPALGPGSSSWLPYRKSGHHDSRRAVRARGSVSRGKAGSIPFPPSSIRSADLLGLFVSPGSRTADRKSAGASGALEAPVIIGGPSRTRTLDPLIKSRRPRPPTRAHDDTPR
jgi:hypothetical protein